LDEPSTGLDPASRRQLWGVIANAKKGKSIILTTHSMEEAELLGDRVGIMAGGLFQCIGISTNLKKQYGSGYTCSITTSDRSDETNKLVLKAIQAKYPSARLRNIQLGGTSNFEIAKSEIVISDVFEFFSGLKAELGIVDWMISDCTLEEVFMHLAEKANAKTDE